MSLTIKGLFTSLQEKTLGKILDDLKDWKNPILEWIDGKLATGLVGLIDDNGLERIPDKFKIPLREIVDLAFAKDYDGVEQKGAEFIAGLVDIPLLDEDAEVRLAKTGLEFLVDAIRLWAQRKKQEDK